MLSKISKANFGEHITIKGGVVMMNLSKDNRRATRDLDLDFIRYSLSDEAINTFVRKLDSVNDNIRIEIKGKIKELKQQDYKGKRVIVSFYDESKTKHDFKLDLGVHTNLELEQDELVFDLNSSLDSVTLLVNSKEQIMSEKLKSILKHGVLSTRFKDIFDMYYLTQINKVDTDKFKQLVSKYILEDKLLEEKIFSDIYKSLKQIFSNEIYRKTLESKTDDNWLKISVNELIEKVLDFYSKL
jgi:hypothetical protein